MSSPLAIAAVTAVLKDLLNEGVINHDLAAHVGSFTVERAAAGSHRNRRAGAEPAQPVPLSGDAERRVGATPACPRSTAGAMAGSPTRRWRSICTTCSPRTAMTI